MLRVFGGAFLITLLDCTIAFAEAPRPKPATSAIKRKKTTSFSNTRKPRYPRRRKTLGKKKKSAVSSYPSDLLLRRSRVQLPSLHHSSKREATPQHFMLQLRQNRGAIKWCYEKSVRGLRSLSPQAFFPLRMSISAKGRVLSVKVGVGSPKMPIIRSLEACLRKVLRSVRFRTGGQAIKISYPVMSDPVL